MRLNNYYQKNLVFQQEKAFVVKGTEATSSLKVFLKQGDRIVESKLQIDNEGCFKATFEPKKASNVPFSLIAIDKEETIEISPIFCGDVFLCLGQSNMSLPLKYTEDYYHDSVHNNAYLTIIDSFYNDEDFIYRPNEPLKDITNLPKWKKINEDRKDMSAIGYILLSLLDDKVDYPIAVVVVAGGGFSIDTFLALEDINNNKEVKDFLVKTGKYQDREDKATCVSFRRTSGLYNEKIAPILDARFKSIIYYQGENSAYDLENAMFFESALNLLIDSYRKRFNDIDLPFFLFGIADEYYCYGDGYGYSYISEVLSNFEKENVYLVPIYDIKPRWLVKNGNTINHPIHTVNKMDYTKRLFNIIYKNLCKKEKCLPAKIKEGKIIDNKIVLTIDTFSSKLKKEAGYDGFFISNEDNIYKKAEAKYLDDNHIVLSSKNVKNPKNYLYGLFQYSYLANCKTINGLPLLPSRSIREEMDKIHYQTNHVYSCDVIKIIENNFGADVGGGFPINLWEKGSIYPLAKVSISLNKKEKPCINVKAKLDKNCFGFFSVCANIGCAGLLHALAYFPYLNVDLKGDEEVSFCGALFRFNGHIDKFPIYGNNTQESPLNQNWNTYSLDLNNIIDGALGPANISKEIIDSLSFIELYFRSSKKVVNLSIGGLDLSNESICKNENNKQTNKEESSIKVPEATNGR